MRPWIAWFAAFAIGGCVTSGTPRDVIKEGATFRDRVHVGVGDQSVPLPEGEWVVGGTFNERTSVGTIILNFVLFQREGNQISKMVLISTPRTTGTGRGYEMSGDCGRNDAHYRKTEANTYGGSQNCRLVDHRRLAWPGGPPDHWKSFVSYVDRERIRRPHTLVGSLYRFANAHTYLDADYMSNPENEGFAPAGSDWSSSNWHRSNLPKDPRKVEYINRAIAWTDGWYSVVLAGFEGRPTAPQMTPAVTAPVQPASSGKAPAQ